MNRLISRSRPIVLLVILAVVLALLLSGCSWFAPCCSSRLTIVHTNDVHSHLLSYQAKGLDNQPAEVGGYARIATIVQQIRDEEWNVLLLDSGDIFYPYSLRRHKGEPEIGCMNILRYDCAAVGNHEFDLGDGPLGHAIDLAQFPFLCANIDVSGSEALAGMISPFIIKQIGSR
ncbi:metallophosphoesterase, partial [bacterium]|nr:metallophosphoesterase [bacterium]